MDNTGIVYAKTGMDKNLYQEGHYRKNYNCLSRKLKKIIIKILPYLLIPANCNNAFSDTILIPKVTTSNGTKAEFLSIPRRE